jgi:hypothetical protein
MTVRPHNGLVTVQGVGVGVAVDVGVAVGVGVGVGAPDSAQYLPPLFNGAKLASSPPQTIISLSVHTPVWALRAVGALVVLAAVQLSAPGLYLPPVFETMRQSLSLHPPQTIISLPVHTAVCRMRPVDALVMLVAVQPSVVGLYLPPVSKGPPIPFPPQTIISLSVHTPV